MTRVPHRVPTEGRSEQGTRRARVCRVGIALEGESPIREQESPVTNDQPAARPRIYVASLADYNAGRLHGRWIGASQSASDIWKEIKRSSRSPQNRWLKSGESTIMRTSAELVSTNTSRLRMLFALLQGTACSVRFPRGERAYGLVSRDLSQLGYRRVGLTGQNANRDPSGRPTVGWVGTRPTPR